MDFKNFVILDGNLTRDTVFRVTKGGRSVINFGLATNKRIKNKDTGNYDSIPQYHNCTAWGKQAELIRDHFRSGDGIKVSGSIEYGEYEKDGIKHRSTTIAITNFDWGFRPKRDNPTPEQIADSSDNYVPSQEELDEGNRMASEASAH